MSIGEKIKKLRLQHGDTLREMGAKLNFNYSNLSKIERGDRNPSIELLESICKLYDVQMSYFIEVQSTPQVLKEAGVEYIAIDKTLKEELTEEDIRDALELVRDLKKEGKIDFDKLNKIQSRK